VLTESTSVVKTYSVAHLEIWLLKKKIVSVTF